MFLIVSMLWTHQNKVLEDIKQTTNTVLTASWHAFAKLLTVSGMSKVNYRNKVLPFYCLDDLLLIISSQILAF